MRSWSACSPHYGDRGCWAQTGEPTLIQGYVMGTANLVGTLTPQNIAINGSLMGRNAQILGHPLGDLSTLLSGSIDDEKATIRADGIPFLGGIWNLGATYVTEREDEPIYATTIDLSVDGLPLINVSDFLSMPNVSGTFAGHWLINFPGLNPDPAKIDLSGSGKIQQFVASYLVADEVNFTTTLKDSIFKIDPVRLTRGHYGRIDAGAELSLDQWRQVNASLRFTAFPIDITPAALNLQLWGGSDAIRIDLPSAAGQLGAAYAIPMLYVPTLFWTHLIALWLLLRPAAAPARLATAQTA